MMAQSFSNRTSCIILSNDEARKSFFRKIERSGWLRRERDKNALRFQVGDIFIGSRRFHCRPVLQGDDQNPLPIAFDQRRRIDLGNFDRRGLGSPVGQLKLSRMAWLTLSAG